MVHPNSAGNPLSAQSLAITMATSLPKREGPQIKNAYAAIALAVHAGMVAVGFRLVGLGEDHNLGSTLETRHRHVHANAGLEAQAEEANPQSLPSEWDGESSSFAFRYARAQSAMQYLVKVTRLGGKAVIFGLALGDDKTTNFEVTVKDYISESQLPINLDENASPEDSAKTIQNLFISTGRLNDLGSLLKTSVIQKLAPGLHKQGYEEETQNERPRNPPHQGEPRDPQRPPTEPQPARPHPFDDPLAGYQGGRRPLPEPIPGFEDEYEINNRARGDLRDGRFPVGIGHDDLYPQGLGPHDPLRPHLGGGPLPGGPFGGGMHPTFDDPLFRGQGGQGGYDPQAPPGARYDPVGPGDESRDNRGVPRFPGGGGRGGFGGFGGPGGAPPNPFGGFGQGDFL